MAEAPVRWRTQYQTMRRGFDRLTAYGAGTLAAESTEAHDRLLHFVQDAFHLKDWIKNDGVPKATRVAVEDLFCASNSECFRPGTHDLAPVEILICADLANGSKHLVQTEKYVRVPGVGIVSQSTKVRPATAGSGLPPDPSMHSWEIRANGVAYDAVTLAGDIVAIWDKWLPEHDLQLDS